MCSRSASLLVSFTIAIASAFPSSMARTIPWSILSMRGKNIEARVDDRPPMLQRSYKCITNASARYVKLGKTPVLETTPSMKNETHRVRSTRSQSCCYRSMRQSCYDSAATPPVRMSCTCPLYSIKERHKMPKSTGRKRKNERPSGRSRLRMNPRRPTAQMSERSSAYFLAS